MGRLNKRNFGRVSGKVGDIVFRDVNGVTIIASSPTKYTTPQDEKSVKNRNKFSFMQSLASAIGEIYWFKQIWKASKVPGYIFTNKVFTVNKTRVTADYNINDILLIPVEEGFYTELVSSSFTTKGFTVTLTAPGDESGIKTNKKVSAQGLVYLRNPKNQEKTDYKFIPVFTDDIVAVFGEQLTFTFNFSDLEKGFYKAYNSHSFVINLITKNTQGEPKNASVNICG